MESFIIDTTNLIGSTRGNQSENVDGFYFILFSYFTLQDQEKVVKKSNEEKTLPDNAQVDYKLEDWVEIYDELSENLAISSTTVR